jgi:hypothetical protein
MVEKLGDHYHLQAEFAMSCHRALLNSTEEMVYSLARRTPETASETPVFPMFLSALRQ